MGLERYFFHDFWTAKELNDVEQRLHNVRRRASSDARKTSELEADLAFLALMNRALLQILIDHNLCTKEGLLDKMKEFDTLDGEADGGLTTEALAGDLGAPQAQKKKAEPIKRRRRR